MATESKANKNATTTCIVQVVRLVNLELLKLATHETLNTDWSVLGCCCPFVIVWTIQYIFFLNIFSGTPLIPTCSHLSPPILKKNSQILDAFQMSEQSICYGLVPNHLFVWDRNTQYQNVQEAT